MFGLSVALTFAVGPAFYKKVMLDQNHLNRSSRVTHFSLDYVFDSKEYVQLKLITSTRDTLRKNYFIPEKEYKKVISFLFSNKFTISENIRETIPIELNTKQLKILENIRFKAHGNVIETLAIGDYYLVGSNPTITAKVLYYGLGTLFVILGLLAFLLSSLTLYDTFKTYQKTGRFPDLPNSIENKINGFMYVLRGFKSKTK